MSKALGALECWQWLDATIPQWVREKDKEHPNVLEPIQQDLLKAEKYEKIILGIEDYINRRIKVEPLEDVRKAFIEIRNQFDLLKEVLK